MRKNPYQYFLHSKKLDNYFGNPETGNYPNRQPFFQTKIIPLTLWNACDYVIQINFTLAHNRGKNNRAADYLSCLDTSPKEKSILKIRRMSQHYTSNRRESLKKNKSSTPRTTMKQTEEQI